MNIVLVHGFLNRGGILRILARNLERDGHTCWTPNLRPCDAREGIAALAQELAREVDAALGPNREFALVGFSLGAIIGRYYIQEMQGHRRVRLYVSIAGPHGGTRRAHLYPSRGVRELRPGSDFLQRLDRGAGVMQGIPITCYWTPFDLMVRPVASACWGLAECVRIPSILHSLMVFDPRLSADLMRRLRAA